MLILTLDGKQTLEYRVFAKTVINNYLLLINPGGGGRGDITSCWVRSRIDLAIAIVGLIRHGLGLRFSP